MRAASHGHPPLRVGVALLVLALADACGGQPPPVSSASASVGESSSSSSEGSSAESSSSDAGTDTGDGSDDGSETSETSETTGEPQGCADAGNLPGEHELRPASLPSPAGLLPIPADMGSGVPACDVYAQDCPADEKCVPHASTGGSWDAVKCVPVMGAGVIGEPCNYAGVVEATDDCGADSACWLVDDQGVGVCTGFCAGSAQAPECPAGQSCLALFDAVAFCIDGCNPLTQACPSGQACMWNGESFGCALTHAKFPAGEVCGEFDDCGVGLICVDAAALPSCGGAACCAEFCDLDCPVWCSQVGTTCVAFFEQGQAPIGDADIGVCVAA